MIMGPKPVGVAADLGLAGDGDQLASELERQKKLQRQRLQGNVQQTIQPFGGMSVAAMDLGLTANG